MEKKCSNKNGCGLIKPVDQFVEGLNWCKSCKKIYNKKYGNIYRIQNHEQIKLKTKEKYNKNKDKIKKNRELNKEKINLKKKNYYHENKKYISKQRSESRKLKQKLYREKERIREKKYAIKKAAHAKKYQQNKRKINPNFRLRQYISSSINKKINKNGKSCMKYLSYSVDQLKRHLESLFESWMTWENHGRYHPKIWDDNDSSTWMWQIDHIIPHSVLPYTSMEDENFKKCWSLENLRPYSAKQNLLDGVNRTRHS